MVSGNRTCSLKPSESLALIPCVFLLQRIQLATTYPPSMIFLSRQVTLQRYVPAGVGGHTGAHCERAFGNFRKVWWESDRDNRHCKLDLKFIHE